MIKNKYHMLKFSVKLPVNCDQLIKYQRLSFVMDETIIYLSKPLDHQLHQIHAPFEEVSQQTFHQLQTHYRGLRSLIYRSTDIELANGNSQVSFYSLCYIKKNMRTSFFVAKSLFVVPPYMFLGDHEEAKIVQWLTKDKASFFKQQRASVQPSKTPVLTAEERQEVEECTKIFQQMNQLDEQDTADIDSDSDTELPNFSLEFDFLSYRSW